MKKRTGLGIAGGILEIIAGMYWLSYSLFALIIYSKIENGLQTFDWVQLILPLCFIIFGIMAIIGKRKKDLVSFGVINLLFVAYIIYKACIGATALSHLIFIILLFSGEIILLLISSFFFFFTKKSEYEIVFDEKFKKYKNDEPLEHKKLKNILIISGAILLASNFLAMLLSLSTKANGTLYVIVAFTALICYTVLLIIILQKNKTSYGFKANIIFSIVAIIISLVSNVFVSVLYNYDSTSMTVGHPQLHMPVENTYLYYYSVENRYLVLECDENKYFAINCQLTFDTLPEGSVSIIEKCGYFDVVYNIEKSAYKFFDTTKMKFQYYLFEDQQITDKIPEYKTTQTTEINKALMIIILAVGAIIGLTLILCTKDAQLEAEVNKQLKIQIQQKIINKHSPSQQPKIILPPRPPKPPLCDKSDTK